MSGTSSSARSSTSLFGSSALVSGLSAPAQQPGRFWSGAAQSVSIGALSGLHRRREGKTPEVQTDIVYVNRYLSSYAALNHRHADGQVLGAAAHELHAEHELPRNGAAINEDVGDRTIRDASSLGPPPTICDAGRDAQAGRKATSFDRLRGAALFEW